ncbi:TRAP transporter large permease [Pikeienuella sp. HZG-20]|uniref:TRAP transporter large permease n=1 Tax=Paludibacillus litoralis TaxID=3133267 RepID=UPI0030EEE60E
MDSILLIAGLVFLIIVGAPIALAMIVLPVVYILVTGAAPLLTVPHQMYEALAKFPLVAIPFFMLTGELMNSSTVTDRILRLSGAIVGRMRGGLAQVNVVASMFFAGMNGSAVADTATIGTIMIPEMKRRGYSAEFSAAITAIGSTIGGIIPPSIAMIILASGANLSVGALFAGGVVPGLLIGILLMAACWVIAALRDYERGDQPFSIGGVFRAFRSAAFALMIPVVLVAGIFGGWFSSVEAGAITAAVALIVGAVVYRSLSLREIFAAFDRTLKLSASVFIIIAAAGPFSWLLARIGTLAELDQWLGGMAGSPILFAAALVALILVAGMFMDATANIIVLGPMLVANCVAAGFEPVQAAIVVVVGFLLGIVTPPVGVCYFTASAIAGAKLGRVAVALLPFLAIELFVLALILALSPLTLALPRALGLL